MAVLDYGHGLADLTRRPWATTRDFITNLTPGQAATLAAGFAAGRLPGGRTVLREGIDQVVDERPRAPAKSWVECDGVR